MIFNIRQFYFNAENQSHCQIEERERERNDETERVYTRIIAILLQKDYRFYFNLISYIIIYE